MSSGQWLFTNTGVNKRPTFSCLRTPLLIADTNTAALEGMASVLRASMPSITLILCSSHSYAMHRLTTARYQVVLYGAQVAEAEDFRLLKQHRAFQPAVPILLVAQRQERDLVQRALDQGVEDIVVWPLLNGQLAHSVQQAMCLYQTRLTMADRHQCLSALHEGQSLSPKQTRRARRRLEANVKDLARVVQECERDAQKRAIEHFDLLGRSDHEVNHT